MCVGGRGIADVLALSVAECDAWFRDVKLGATEHAIAQGPLREIQSRLSFLLNVGLEYLTLDRSGPTLSGGGERKTYVQSRGSQLGG